MQDDLAALAADAIFKTRKPWEFLRLRATVRLGARDRDDRMNHRLTSGPSEEHVRFHHPPSLRTFSRDVVLEMRIERDGTFKALLTNGIKQFTGYLPPSYTVVLQQRPRHLFEPYERIEVVGEGPLAHVETAIGARIPAEVHDLYRSGRTDRLIPADEILAVRQELLESERWLAEDPRRWDHHVPSRSLSHPGAVQRVVYHPLWVPISRDPRFYGARCVDLAPGPDGRVGQLVKNGRLLAHSVTDWLDDPTPLEEYRYDHVSMTVHDPTPAELASLPKDIRSLTLVATRHVDLTAADLSELDQLTSVEVRGARIDLPPLPQVRMFRASEADIDVAQVPTELDYLVLNVEQWRRCSVRPAAARLVGERSLARALDWAEGLGATLPREVVSGGAAWSPPRTPPPDPGPPRTPAAPSR